MDYTVFLLATVKAVLDRTGDARQALVEGLAGTGRVINAAAAVMVVVFMTFALSGPIAPREMGVILAVAVLLDATLIRLLLQPVVLRLLGARAWWMPAWLDRLVPSVGPSHERPAEPRPASRSRPRGAGRLVASRRRMEFRLLGPMEVLDGDAPVALGGLKQRALLARLLVSPNRTVAVDRLVDDLWGEPCRTRRRRWCRSTSRSCASRCRTTLLVTRPPGYLVEVDPEAIDVARFDRLRRTGHAALEAGEAAAAAAQLREALGLWRGEALAEFAEPFAQAERDHLDELRLGCLEDRFEADLLAGRHAELVAELAAEIVRFPLRERLRRQSMLALYRSGRHADALAVYQEFRRRLDDDLGLEPSLELRELQGRILNQDPSLELPPPGERRPRDARTASRRGARRLVRGAWDEAKAAFERALADGEEAEALEGWAQATRFLGDGDASLEARARAFRAYRGRGDARSAARVAAWLAYDTVVFRGDDAVAQGWFGHAHRLLEDDDDGEEQGWLAFLEGEVALVAHGDTARAAEHAARALDVGRRTGVMDLEMLALSLTGLARVAGGRGRATGCASSTRRRPPRSPASCPGCTSPAPSAAT